MDYKTYKQYREDRQAAISAILSKYAFFAFSDEQFTEGLQSLGLEDKPGSLRKLYRLNGGGFILKEHYPKLKDAAEAAADEFTDRANDPETGDRFLYEAFLEELYNHEFSYTGDARDALDALGLEIEDMTGHQRALLAKACNEVLQNSF